MRACLCVYVCACSSRLDDTREIFYSIQVLSGIPLMTMGGHTHIHPYTHIHTYAYTHTGVEWDAPDDDGWTPFLLAAASGHVDIVCLLLEAARGVYVCVCVCVEVCLCKCVEVSLCRCVEMSMCGCVEV